MAVPAAWSAGMAGSEPTPFVPVEPSVVAEVETDTALDGPFGRIRHRCRHIRIRLAVTAFRGVPDNSPEIRNQPA